MSRSRKLCNVVGVNVDCIDWVGVVSLIANWAKERASKIICICNVHMAITAASDPELAEVLAKSDLVTADGAPIAWAIRRSGIHWQERINGPDLMWRYLGEAQRNGQVVFFYGGMQDTLHKLRQVLDKEFSHLKIGGMISPPFKELSTAEEQSYVDLINQSGASVLFVGLGCPKQEKWMLRNRGKVNSVMIGVGAAFDYHAGVILRAPLWMQNVGLEWVHRLFSEPKRLWRRYLFTNTKFVLRMFRDGFKGRLIN